MTVSLSSPITGAAQTGFTSPTYTLTTDTAPDVNGKQWAVSALGGTQTNVTVHTVASPFTIAFWKPKVFKLLGIPNPVTGIVSRVPMNQYKLITRKGVQPAADQPYTPMIITTIFEVPAGADTYDSANVRGGCSAHMGAAAQVSAGIGDTLISGVM